MSSFSIFKSSTPDEEVIHQLSELFGNVLTSDVIKTVAASCNFNVQASSNKLLEISTAPEKRKLTEEIDMNEQRCSWRNVAAGGSFSTSSKSIASCSVRSPKKSKKLEEFGAAVENINKGYKVLILMRGLPGSGKSTLAVRVLENTIGFDANARLHILSTDDFFCQNPQNIYYYEVGKIDLAHNWNQSRAFQAMSRGFSPVIIDNTNTQMWEMKAYASMAIDYGYILHILEPDTHWCFNDKELSKRNCHGVPKAKIKDMIDRYEKNITPQKLLLAYNLVYKHQKLPQLRLYPPPDIRISKPGNVVKSTSLTFFNNKSDQKQMETIDLMEFDDDEDSRSTKSQPVTDNHSFWQDPVDKILMATDNNETGVLKPITNQQNCEYICITDDEDDDDKISEELERKWGIKETTLKSWDIVTPINGLDIKEKPPKVSVNNQKVKKEYKEVYTLTEDEYFRLVKNDSLVPGFYGGIYVLETVNRDINHSTPKREPNISYKLTLDKGCMTEDVYEDYENHISELENLFPSVPKTHLIYWYKKCKGDLEWTIEFLLEGKDEITSLIVDDDTDDKNLETKTETVTEIKQIENKVSKKKMRKNHGTSPDDKEEIKRLIESKIDIGGEHYSKHLLRVKNFKTKSPKHQPSTSKASDSDSNSDEIISVDSDIEFDDIEQDTNDKTVELNLGEVFVTQLEQQFADPNIQYPKGFQPVVQIPLTLAKQLYSFYIESVYQQMENQQNILETLVKEDEEFARKLQANENDSTKTTNSVSFKEIQEDQQASKRAYQKEVEKWKNLNPDTLAMKLTKQKLFSTFTTIPEDTLMEVLQAHDNKYTDTIETLLASTKLELVQESLESIKQAPIKDEVLMEMKEAQKNSSCEESEQRHEAQYYREEANRYFQKRTDLYQKAQQYHQRGMTEVAQFYSGLASLQTSYFDIANSMAATAFLDEHSKRLKDFNTLDLHHLYVKEAIPALDLFLDRNINLLRHSTNQTSESLQIITGRGKRSENGISKIRPAVISRLRKRKIKYVNLNPGLLQVKINKNSKVTSEFLSS